MQESRLKFKCTDHMIWNHLYQLGTVHNDNVSTIEKFLEKDNSVTIHVILTREFYKIKDNLAAPIMYEMFWTEEYPT